MVRVTFNKCVAHRATATTCGCMFDMKAVRGLTALQGTSCETDQKAHADFAKLLECARLTKDVASDASYSAARLISSSDAGFSNADVSPSFSPRYAARTMRRITFAFRVFGMSPTNKTSLGASALPSWAANAFSKL